jgi:hypothetical protein
VLLLLRIFKFPIVFKNQGSLSISFSLVHLIIWKQPEDIHKFRTQKVRAKISIGDLEHICYATAHNLISIAGIILLNNRSIRGQFVY